MTVPAFDTHVIVDWSASNSPSPAKPSADAIWIGVVRDQKPATTSYHRTRAEAVSSLIALIKAEQNASRRVLLGFDFPFGYPSGFAEKITGTPDALSLWRHIAGLIEDNDDNTNNRFEVAARLNSAFTGTGPFWGCPASQKIPNLPAKGAARSGTDNPPERRLVERAVPQAQPVWKLYTTGSVGSQVLTGLPALLRIKAAIPDCAVWPFETGLNTPEAPVVLAEIYPSLLAETVKKRSRKGSIKDQVQVAVTAQAYARLDAQDQLSPLFAGAPDLSPAERETIASEEAWILGAGHETILRAAASQPQRAMTYLKDPDAIYEESFAIVAAETRLERFPPDLRPVVTRLVHACGMPEIADRLSFSGDAAQAGIRALSQNATILCDCEMVRSGLIASRLSGNKFLTTLNDRKTRDHAAKIGNTRSAAAVDLWEPHIEGAIVTIGNAPTALFRLLENLDRGWPRPALILGFPVGFVGAAEAKAELARDPRGTPFLTLCGRKGGSAIASAAVNALAVQATQKAAPQGGGS